MAGESRLFVTGTVQTAAGPQSVLVNYDNATKLFSLGAEHSYVGVVTYGLGTMGSRSAFSFIPEFGNSLPEGQRLPVGEFAGRMAEFYLEQWRRTMPSDFSGPGMTFIVAGFNEGEPYGRLFLFEIPGQPIPSERNPDQDGEAQFGITWGGQREFVDRLLRGYDTRVLDILRRELAPEAVAQIEREFDRMGMNLPLGIMPLQDCIDTAILFLRTTIDAQRLTLGVRGCGGAIDIATITRPEGFRFVQQKRIRGERAEGY